MYDLLSNVSRRPEPFSRYTVKELWTRPHLAQQMLAYHLSQETDLASRTYDSIDRAVEWIDTQLGLSGKSLCDLGCGPGLYAQRFESKGANVTGVVSMLSDLSPKAQMSLALTFPKFQLTTRRPRARTQSNTLALTTLLMICRLALMW
jgi:SAM-dependent methyltransferase